VKILVRCSLAALLTFAAMNRTPAQWVQTNGPYGRHVSSFLVSGERIFALSSDSIYLSTNEGDSWTGISNGLSSGGFDFQSFTAIGPHLFVRTLTGSCFHSTNNGVSWSGFSDSLSGAPIWHFLSHDSNLFIGTFGAGVFLSNDTGATWTAVNNGLPNLRISGLFAEDRTLIAFNDSGFFLSANNGASWSRVRTAANGMGDLFGGDSILYSAVRFGVASGIYGSTDSGNTWTLLTGGGPEIIASKDTRIIFSTDPRTSGEVYESTDNGANWKNISSGLTNRDITSFALTDSVLLGGTEYGGVYRSTDNGASWHEANTGLPAQCGLSVTSLALSGGNLFAGTWGGGIFRSSNDGASWREINDGLGIKHVLSLAVRGTKIFAGTNLGGVFLSENEGEHWTAVNNGLPIDHTVLHSLPLAFCDTVLFTAIKSLSGGIFRTTDNGANWTAVNNDLPISFLGSVTCFAVSDTIIYAGGSSVFRSTNNGSNWIYDTTGMPFSDGNVISLMVIDSNIFAGNFTDGISRSTINGKGWYAANTGLETMGREVPCLTSSGKNIFAGVSTDGIYLSTNEGGSWHAVDRGDPYENVYALIANDSIIYAGMYGGTAGGIRYRRISEFITDVSRKSNQSLPHFALAQNYPNPFNPITVIRYQLAAKSRVNLKVYDMLGRTVATLVDEEKPAATYSVTFDASKLSSGIYFYRLVANAVPMGRAGAFTETRKFVLLK
jgi:photosystem II stability/assembly factor-like uncharacterized protein